MPQRPNSAMRKRRPRLPLAGGASSNPGPLAPGAPSDVKGVDLPLPHERDQSLGEVSTAPDGVMRQAKRDLDAGLVDTDMRATPGLDAARRERLVPTPDLQTGPKPTSTTQGRAVKRR